MQRVAREPRKVIHNRGRNCGKLLPSCPTLWDNNALYLHPECRRGMKASVATATRYDSVACDERNFSSSEERASAPLGLSSPRSVLQHSSHAGTLPVHSARFLALLEMTRYVLDNIYIIAKNYVGQDKISSWARKIHCRGRPMCLPERKCFSLLGRRCR